MSFWVLSQIWFFWWKFKFFLVFSQFEFCQNLSFWVVLQFEFQVLSQLNFLKMLSQLELLSFVTIWLTDGPTRRLDLLWAAKNGWAQRLSATESLVSVSTHAITCITLHSAVIWYWRHDNTSANTAIAQVYCSL